MEKKAGGTFSVYRSTTLGEALTTSLNSIGTQNEIREDLEARIL